MFSFSFVNSVFKIRRLLTLIFERINSCFVAHFLPGKTWLAQISDCERLEPLENKVIPSNKKY